MCSLSVVCVTCLSYITSFFFFFFQAEDGIRDLVRSRGLGDVYKRQDPRLLELLDAFAFEHFDDLDVGDALRLDRIEDALGGGILPGDRIATHGAVTVSYTHLTLPTSDLV